MPLTRKRSSQTRKNTNRGRFIGPIQQKAKSKKGTQKQARFNVSAPQYKINQAVSSAMSKMSETKLLACTNVNAGASNGTPSI